MQIKNGKNKSESSLQLHTTRMELGEVFLLAELGSELPVMAGHCQYNGRELGWVGLGHKGRPSPGLTQQRSG